MKNARILLVLVIATLLSACISTTRFAAEYNEHYFLAEDVHAYRSASFTGIHSLWFTGPEDVETICSAKIPVARAITIKKGSPVRIVKIFQTAAIDSSSSEAKLQIVDRETQVTHLVYVRWPGSKALLANESTDPHR